MIATRGFCREATKSSIDSEGRNWPSSLWFSMTFSVRPTDRLWMATLKPLRARLRARFEPITAIPVTPISAEFAGAGSKVAMDDFSFIGVGRRVDALRRPV